MSKNRKNILRSLTNTIGYVYKNDLKKALIRDFAFVLITALDMTGIAVGGKFIDSTADILLRKIPVNSLYDYFVTDSFRWLAIILAIYIVTKALKNFRQATYERMLRKVDHTARVEMIRKISSENLQEVEQNRFQELTTFVPGYSIGSIFSTYEAFTEVIRQSIRLVSSIIILGSTMGSSVFFLLIIAIPEPLIQFIGERRLRTYRKDKVEHVKYTDYLMNTSMTIPNFPELRVNGIFKTLLKNYRQHDQEFIEGVTKRYDMYYSDQVVMSATGQIFMYIYTIFVLFESIRKKLSIGDFKALFDYTNEVYEASYNLLRQLLVMFDQVSYTTEFFDLIEYKGFGDMDPTGRLLTKGTPLIELQNLDFQYPDEPEVKVLRDVNVTIKPGQKVAFVGGDGSGKSSLVKTLCGLYEIVAGDYVLDGLSVRELKRGELKGKISVAFQNFVRYSFSLQENITISSDRVNLDKRLYQQVKNITGVTEFMKKEKLTDKSILGKEFTGGKDISPGYWQRLAIARMLYRNKGIFIMDEPFTYIDGPSQEKMIKEILKFIGNKKTLIYITQNTDHLDMFDTVYYIHDGKIVESGSYNQLMKKKGKFYKEARANQ